MGSNRPKIYAFSICEPANKTCRQIDDAPMHMKHRFLVSSIFVAMENFVNRKETTQRRCAATSLCVQRERREKKRIRYGQKCAQLNANKWTEFTGNGCILHCEQIETQACCQMFDFDAIQTDFVICSLSFSFFFFVIIFFCVV